MPYLMHRHTNTHTHTVGQRYASPARISAMHHLRLCLGMPDPHRLTDRLTCKQTDQDWRSQAENKEKTTGRQLN